MGISENIQTVKERIRSAALRAGRDPHSVKIIGVTKTVGPDAVLEMARCGIGFAGENRVQELVSKRAALAASGADIEWHLIGHLQTNKAKQAVESAALIHSVDSTRLADTINAYAAASGRAAHVLVQVNIAAEKTKFGVPAGDTDEFIHYVSSLPYINIRGLMCIAPFVDEAEENRKYFRKMYDLMVDNNKKLPHNKKMEELSMGMTQDYAVAIEEGATMVRIGTALFGVRT